MDVKLTRRIRGALALVALVLVATIATINWAVRSFGGGDPALLSPRYLPEKVGALGGLFFHYAIHPFIDCASDPRPLLEQAARDEGVPIDLILAVAMAESDQRPHRISRAGAMGLMQLSPATAKALGVSDPFRTDQSARAGAQLLGRLWRRYRGDRKRVAAAYNAGPGVVPRKGPLSLPGETEAYVRKVDGWARLYRRSL